MSITSHELVEMLQQTSLGALSQEVRHLETVMDTIWRSNVVASLDSQSSLFLREVVETCKPYLLPETNGWIVDLDLYGVQLPACDAVPRLCAGQRQIIIFDGLLQVIRSYGELVATLKLLAIHRPGRQAVVRGITEPEVQAYTRAGLSVIAHYIETGELAYGFERILGKQARMRTAVGFKGAVFFVIAHEAAHLELGHLRRGRPFSSERAPVALAIDESQTQGLNNELEADAAALQALLPEAREWFFPCVLAFLGPFALLEAFGRPRSKTHPLCSNRTAQLASLVISSNAENHKAIQDIVANRVAWFRQLEECRLGEEGGDIRHRILQNLPLDEAVTILTNVLADVRSAGDYLDDRETELDWAQVRALE